MDDSTGSQRKSTAPAARRTPWISAAEAARLLGVSRATLYAYVSRKLVRSQAMPGPRRNRGYAREDVERLRRRTEERRQPDKAAAHALQWGLPVLESAIALIDGQRLFYRGHDVMQLARSRSVQAVASLIWTGDLDVPFAPPSGGRAPLVDGSLPFIARAQAALLAASANDPLAYETNAEGLVATGWRILRLMARVAANMRTGDGAVEDLLADAWGVGAQGANLLRAALVLCADHELNVSAFTARCVASAGATPYAAVLAGLAAFGGIHHGGHVARSEAMLAALRRERAVAAAIAARRQRGALIEGFGHPLYPRGDPRAELLMQLLRESYPRSAELAFVERVIEAAALSVGRAPNIDFGVAAMARVLRLPAGAPMMLFAVGRTIGWIGHAIEQYATGQLIRPRAKYVGPVPAV